MAACFHWKIRHMYTGVCLDQMSVINNKMTPFERSLSCELHVYICDQSKFSQPL